MAPISKALERRQGLVDGDGVKDSSVYFEQHGVLADVVGRDAGVPAFRVRGLAANNVPTEVFRVDKNGQATVESGLTVAGIDVTGQIASNAALAQAAYNLASASVGQLVNPGLEVWQRGAGAFTANGAYTADRWSIVLATSTCSVTRIASAAGTPGFSAQVVYTHSGAGTCRLQQNLEQYAQLAGRVLTGTVVVQSTVAARVRVFLWDSVSGFTYSAYNTGTATQTLTVTATVNAAATGIAFGVQIDTGTCTVEVNDAVLVAGPTAPTFAPLSPALDLALCQRYYQVMGGLDVNEYALMMQAISTTVLVGVWRFPVEMAVAPTITGSAAADWAVFNAAGTLVACTVIAANNPTKRSVRVTLTVASGVVAGNASVMLANTTTNARLVAEANP